MTRNMGTIDRLVRGLLVAPLALILALVVGIGSVAGVILAVVRGRHGRDRRRRLLPALQGGRPLDRTPHRRTPLTARPEPISSLCPRTSTRRTVMDVSAESFDTAVIERSHELPVIVDFWAPWCSPCHRLAPVLEQEIARRNGAVELVKVNVDVSPELASRYAISGIPSVKAFSDGLVVNQFVGAIPPAAVSGFLDAIQDEVAA